MRSIVLAAITAVTVQYAHATEFCLIKQTADGFVALRANPSSTAGVISQMKPGEEVRPTGRSSGVWRFVHWWRGETRIASGVDKPDARGWVHRSLIEDCG